MKKRRTHIIALLIGLLALLGFTAGLKSCDSTVKLPSFDNSVNTVVSENAKKVDDLIGAIKTPITLESAGAIAAARSAYDALSNDDKAKVTLLDKLVDYENTLKGLDTSGNLVEGTADWLKNLIAGINPSNISLPDLAKARLAYEALDPSEKAKFDLPSLEKLELDLPDPAAYLNELLKGISLPIKAEDGELLGRIRTLYDGMSDADKAKFDLPKLEEFEASLKLTTPEGVIDLINSIPTPITLDCENAINAALNGYNALSDADKAKVSNYNTLSDYLNKLNELKNPSSSGSSGDSSDSSGGLPATGVE